MAYYWIQSKGPCACCGATCSPLYITVQGTQTSLTQSGTTWNAEWTFPTSSISGIAVPAKYMATAQYVPFVQRANTNFFPQTGWANWLCVVDGKIHILQDSTSTQGTTQANLWVDGVMTFVFVCETSQFANAQAAFQADIAANIVKTMGTLTTL